MLEQLGAEGSTHTGGEVGARSVRALDVCTYIYVNHGKAPPCMEIIDL